MHAEGDGPSIRQRRQFKENFVEGVSHRPRYQEGGFGDPLVFLPGIAGLQITGAHHKLAERYRMIGFDVPRVREALVGEAPDLADGVARHLGKCLRALGVESFNLVGSSFGANVALWMAIRQPETIRSLILAAPTARLRASLPPEERQTPFDQELERQLPSVTVPTLVLFGADDLVVSPHAGQTYQDQIPGSRYVRISEAGHALEEDRPDEFVSIVSRFVDDPSGFAANQ